MALQSLLINNLIQGEFPIYNMKDQRVGKLIVNIFWEEINMKSNEAFSVFYSVLYVLFIAGLNIRIIKSKDGKNFGGFFV